MTPNRSYIVNGLRLDSIGLDDVWVVDVVNRTAARVSGFLCKPGLRIVESLLAECPPDHVMIFDPHKSLHENILRLH